MEFRILGPLEVSDEGRRVELGGRKQRSLLAVLLLHANEVVSQDRLIDELWGERPPAAAAKTLHGYVSRLRKALDGEDDAPVHENGVLETRGHGYLLRVEPGQLDADRFQEMLEEARCARAEGKPEEAAEELRRALALWRGPALADFAYEPFAQTEIARLDELQLTALEERIEGDLALGRHAALVGELEALVVRHPLRERLRGQLMLALYRSDRQAEALHVYQEGRLALAEELGLEPSQGLQRLERQILAQDPALAPPARKERPRMVPAPARRHPGPAILLGVILLGVLAAAVAVAVLQLTRGRNAEPIEGPGVRMLDPKTGELLATIPLGTAPSTIAVGDESVWVLDANDRTVSRIDSQERTAAPPFSTASTPTDLAAGTGAIWIGNGPREVSATFGGTILADSVSRLDPESSDVVETIPLPRTSPQGGSLATSQQIVVTGEAVWVINPDLTVSRIDPRTNERVARVKRIEAFNIAAGDGGVWIVEGEGVAEIDPRTNALSRRIEVDAESLTALAVGGGDVWVADPVGGSIWRIDPHRLSHPRSPAPADAVLRQIPLEVGVGAIAFGEGALWAANELTGKVYRIDPRTNEGRVFARIASPRGLAVGEGAVWVTSAGPPSADAALPASACGEVFYGEGGSPRFLLASDLPLQNPGWTAFTGPMVEAIRFVLEQHDFQAGRYTVGYQSCDSSTAQAGASDLYRCSLNAKAFARNLDVIGVIGAFHSFCSFFQIPIANQAPEGPLAMISPSNTGLFLTRSYGVPPQSQLEELYPSGQRNYVRIAAAEHLQSVARAELARRLGVTSLFTLSPRSGAELAGSEWEFADMAANAGKVARSLGLEIAGYATWDPDARDFERLARKIADTGAEGVVINGVLGRNEGKLIRDLRAALGPRVPLIANDGFAAVPELFVAAGPAARGMYISTYGLPNNELPPVGKRFLKEFEASRAGEPSPYFSATYAAQATEILLAAIARSDGTRSSVTRELRRTRIEDGILGDIRFDQNGDLVEGPVTVFRVVGKGDRNSQDGYEGADVDRVVTARVDLLN
jgi:DNA-binding SARP family transcriptional activator/ABC-type branched-subunit amino acid transport system substrate-binding protein